MPGKQFEAPAKVWEITGCTEWEEVPGAVALEAFSGKFGFDFDSSRATIVGPKCDLNRAWLSDVSFLLADLREAKMNGAVLTYASFMMADLRHADLRGARMALSNLAGADLRHADLRGADLSGAVRGKNDEEIPGWVCVGNRLSSKQ